MKKTKIDCFESKGLVYFLGGDFMAKEIEEKTPPAKKKKSASAKKVIKDTPFEKAVREFWEKYYESHKKTA